MGRRMQTTTVCVCLFLPFRYRLVLLLTRVVLFAKIFFRYFKLLPYIGCEVGFFCARRYGKDNFTQIYVVKHIFRYT